MKILHRHLAAKHAWYASWHAKPYHPHVHWGVFAGLCLSVMFYVISAMHTNDQGFLAMIKRTNAQSLSLIAHLKLDEASLATSFADSSGNGNTGSCSGTTCPTSGLSGRDSLAVDFDGVGDYIRVADSNSTDFGTSNFSAAAWFKRPNDATYGTIVADGETTGALNPEFWSLRLNTDGTLYFNTESNNASTAVNTTGTNYADNAWHHAVVVRTGTTLLIYVDGVQRASTTGILRDVSNIEPITIGVEQGSGAFTRNPMSGFIDDVRLYNYAISAGEISTLYASYPVLPTGPNAHWKLDEASGATSFADSSGNGNTGSCSGTTCPTSGLSGRDSLAVDFDGVGDYVDFGDTASLRFGTGNFTITSWIKPTTFDGSDSINALRFLEKNNYPTKWWVIDFEDPDNDNVANIEFEVKDDAGNTGTTLSTGEVLTLNVWSHIAIVIDRTNMQASYYINGVLDSTKAIPVALTGTLDIAGSPFRTSTYNDFKGGMDDTRVYKSALSSAEISALYASFTAPTPTPTPAATPWPSQSPPPVPTCTNPATITSGFTNPCPTLAISSATVSKSAGTLVIAVTPQTSQSYIKKMIFITEGRQWRSYPLFGNSPYGGWSNEYTYITLPNSVISGLSLGTHSMASWDWTWNAGMSCWVGPGSSTCNAGSWRMQSFVVQ